MPSGVELIAAERLRQVEEEGFTAEHDKSYVHGELTRAAECYAHAAQTAMVRDDAARYHSLYGHERWPWGREWWKPSNDPMRNLAKAGALIAAEIDRLQRQGD